MPDQHKASTPDYSVIIPTLNAAPFLPRLLESLLSQTRPPAEILVVDSSSADDTPLIAQKYGTAFLSLPREQFDHGGTRDWALRHTHGEYVVFMTQDALPRSGESLNRLLTPLDTDDQIAAVGGRQLPREDATAYERLVRLHNYPDTNRVWTKEDIPSLGVRAFLISDVFAAYRRSVYLSVGGFDHPIMTNEDMLMAQKLLEAGWKLCYNGKSAVFHSHNLSWRQQYRRNYVVGQTMVRYAERFSNAQEMGEGIALFRHVSGELLREKRPVSLLRFGVDCSARLLGNRIGRKKEARRKQKPHD